MCPVLFWSPLASVAASSIPSSGKNLCMNMLSGNAYLCNTAKSTQLSCAVFVAIEASQCLLIPTTYTHIPGQVGIYFAHVLILPISRCR